MSEKIPIISGDPNSVNSEIIFKTWKNLKKIKEKDLFDFKYKPIKKTV